MQMVSQAWHQGLINDVRHFKTLSPEDAVLKVIRFLKHARVIWDFDKTNVLTYKSLYHIPTVSSGSIIKMIDGSSASKSESDKYQELMEEEQLLHKLYQQLIIHFPITAIKTRYYSILYHHFLLDKSYEILQKNNLYTQSKRLFQQDKLAIINILEKAWLFRLDSQDVYEDRNHNLYQKLERGQK